MIRIGKQTEGKTAYFPEFKLWGGTLFINWLRRSLMISLPQWVIEFLAMLGIDALGD